MRMLVFAVFDTKVGAFMAPFNMRSRGEAIRSFEVASRDEKLPFRLHPRDYRLMLLAEYDDATGIFINNPGGPEAIIGADEYGVSEELSALLPLSTDQQTQHRSINGS